MIERDLLLRFKASREAVAVADEALKSVRTEERKAEQALLDYLEAKQASATGKYDGVGWAQINSPRLFASCPVEKFGELAVWLRAHGQESAIKETVHSSTLSQIVSEALREGGEVPPGITYFLKQQVRLYGGNND